MERGYIKMWRKCLDSEVFASESLWKLWCCCLMLANHKEKYFSVDGVIAPVKVGPGQFVTGRFAIHKVMYPRKSKKNPNPITVWRWLQNLETCGNLNIKTHNKYSIITIANWDSYQCIENQNVQAYEQQMNNNCTTDEQQLNTNKNVKNEKKEETIVEQEPRQREIIPFSEIVSFLNEKAGTQFKPETHSTKAHIRARWAEKFRVDDFKTVIAHKVDEWKTDSEMNQYLRPTTLFGTKFESYLQAAKLKATDGENLYGKFGKWKEREQSASRR